MRLPLLQSRKKILLLVGFIAVFIAGYEVSNIRAQSERNSLISAFKPLRQDTDWKFVRPLLVYETPETTSLTEYQKLKTKIQRLIDAAVASGNVSEVSIYYRNVSSGKWIGINQNVPFYPASLLKVPVMIAYFRQAEADPQLLDSRIVYQPITTGDIFEMQSSLTAGRSYTVRELIEYMIIESDNGATYTLIDAIDPITLNEVYSDIGIPRPAADTSTYQISTRTYALFFRILFNTTYLSPEYSEEALRLLSKTTYRDGLVAGVPESVTVSHKFGEHIVSTDRKNAEGVELHDCGIVYHPREQYLLCVMTRAKELSDATNMIQSISRETYNTIDADTQL